MLAGFHLDELCLADFLSPLVLPWEALLPLLLTSLFLVLCVFLLPLLLLLLCIELWLCSVTCPETLVELLMDCPVTMWLLLDCPEIVLCEGTIELTDPTAALRVAD